jgi:hypothetical protein
MGTAERVIDALRKLPPERQAEVLDFAEFLKGRLPLEGEPRPYGLCAGQFRVPADFDAPLPADVGAFRRTSLEATEAPSFYRGRPLTLAQMREAVDWEASGSK